MKHSQHNEQQTQESSGDEGFLRRVSTVLDGSLPGMSPAVRKRLDGARHAAMLQAWEPGESAVPGQPGIVRQLDESAEQLPPDVRARLDSIRAGAMQRARAAQAQQADADGFWSRWFGRSGSFALPAGAFASVCVLVITFAVFRQPETQEAMPVLVADNALLLASEEEMELYENLEFYQWLADNGLQY